MMNLLPDTCPICNHIDRPIYQPRPRLSPEQFILRLFVAWLLTTAAGIAAICTL